MKQEIIWRNLDEEKPNNFELCLIAFIWKYKDWTFYKSVLPATYTKQEDLFIDIDWEERHPTSKERVIAWAHIPPYPLWNSLN